MLLNKTLLVADFTSRMQSKRKQQVYLANDKTTRSLFFMGISAIADAHLRNTNFSESPILCV